MDFYNDLITQKSWITLQDLKRKIDFVLIGGWAVYLYTKALKSKDIDIIVSYDNLSKLKNLFPITRNVRLKKYEARNEEVQIDIYLPFYSNLGIAAEEIISETDTMETFVLPKAEMLLILKQYTHRERGLSAKGQKDMLDIISLLAKTSINWGHYKNLLAKFGMKNYSLVLIELLSHNTHIPELNMNQHAYSKLKKKISANLNIEKIGFKSGFFSIY